LLTFFGASGYFACSDEGPGNETRRDMGNRDTGPNRDMGGQDTGGMPGPGPGPGGGDMGSRDMGPSDVRVGDGPADMMTTRRDAAGEDEF
jgi:hypothetical protein